MIVSALSAAEIQRPVFGVAWMPRFFSCVICAVFCLLIFRQPADAAVYEFTSAPTATDTQLSLGFQFTTNVPVSVTALGYFDFGHDGFMTAHDVGIFDASGNLLFLTQLSAGTINPLVGDFRYQAIAPFLLPGGQLFIIAGTTGGELDPWAYGNGFGAGGPPQFGTIAGLTVDPSISIAANAARFVPQSDNSLRNPTEHFSDYTLYAGPNFEIASAVPEPYTWILMLFGFAAIGFLGYRRTAGLEKISLRSGANQ
jgi:hypothetical protein